MGNDFEHVRKAALAISYDNGGVNRDRPEEQVIAELAECLIALGWEDVELEQIDNWLGKLSEDEVEQLCSGEEFEQKIILTMHGGAPARTEELLTIIFERVC